MDVGLWVGPWFDLMAVVFDRGGVLSLEDCSAVRRIVRGVVGLEVYL